MVRGGGLSREPNVWPATIDRTSANASARAGIIATATNADVQAAVNAVMSNAGFTDPSKYTVEIPNAVNSILPPDPVVVTVKMPYTPLGVPPARVNATQVKSTVTMRKEE